jgi:hypothetical protein
MGKMLVSMVEVAVCGGSLPAKYRYAVDIARMG